MNAAIYVRVSAEEQARQGASPEAGERLCQREGRTRNVEEETVAVGRVSESESTRLLIQRASTTPTRDRIDGTRRGGRARPRTLSQVSRPDGLLDLLDRKSGPLPCDETTGDLGRAVSQRRLRADGVLAQVDCAPALRVQYVTGQ